MILSDGARGNGASAPLRRAVALLVLVGFAACGGRSVLTREGSSDDESGRAGAAPIFAGRGGTGGRGSGGDGSGGTGGTGEVGGAGGAVGGSAGRGSAGRGGDGSAGVLPLPAGAGGVGGAAGDGFGGTAGSAATAGRLIQPQQLVGDWDVFVPPLPPLQGCTPKLESSHLNLQIDTAEGFLARPFRDWGYLFVEPQTPFLDDSLFVTDATGIEGLDAVWVPKLSLDIVPDGFAGTGRAEVVYDCPQGSAAASVDVKVLPDTTPPRVRGRSELPTRDRWFPFTAFQVELSEPVTAPFRGYIPTFDDPSDAADSVGLFDVGSDERLPIQWRTALAGPIAQGSFQTLDGNLGRVVAVRPLVNLPDRAGNPAVTADESFLVAEPAELVDILSFDEEFPVGVFGTLGWLPLGDGDASCEAGGCLALVGVGSGCVDGPEPLSFLAISLGESAPEHLRIRYRIQYQDDVEPLATLFTHYPSGCLGTSEFAQRYPMPTPLGPYTYQTDWLESDLGLCGGPDVERGIVLSLGCETPSSTPRGMRLVIDWIEVVNDP